MLINKHNLNVCMIKAMSLIVFFCKIDSIKMSFTKSFSPPLLNQAFELKKLVMVPFLFVDDLTFAVIFVRFVDEASAGEKKESIDRFAFSFVVKFGEETELMLSEPDFVKEDFATGGAFENIDLMEGVLGSGFHF